MTTPKSKTTTSQLLAELESGKNKISLAAENFQLALPEKRAEFKSLQSDPSSVSVSEAVRIITELNGLTELAERFDSTQVGFLQRQFAENFFRENGDTLADAQLADLDAAIASAPRLIEALKKWLGEFPAKIYQPTISDSDKNALLDERESRENAAEILRCNIRDCRAAIEYFRRNPTPENFGPTRSLLAIIRTAVAA